MASRAPKPCLGTPGHHCPALTTTGPRCPTCTTTMNVQRHADRPWYQGTYQTEAKAIRENATHCWICGDGPRPNDPWQADHVDEHTLAPAHRSCNARRGATHPVFQRTH